MIKKIFQLISNTNQILLFIVAILVIVMASRALFDRSHYPGDEGLKVEIYDTQEQQGDPEKTVLIRTFRERINDIYIFNILSTKIDILERFVSHSSMQGMASPSYNSDLEPSLVNIMFVSEDKPSYMLFEKNCLITRVTTAQFNTTKTWKLLHKNLYYVVRNDSNGDGFLSENDRKDLYASDYNGLGVKLILEDIFSHTLIRDNQVLITQGELASRKFFLYDVISGEIDILDTEIELTKHSILR